MCPMFFFFGFEFFFCFGLEVLIFSFLREIMIFDKSKFFDCSFYFFLLWFGGLFEVWGGYLIGLFCFFVLIF